MIPGAESSHFTMAWRRGGRYMVSLSWRRSSLTDTGKTSRRIMLRKIMFGPGLAEGTSSLVAQCYNVTFGISVSQC